MIYSSLIDAYGINLGLLLYSIFYEVLASVGLIWFGFLKFFVQFAHKISQSAGEDWETKSANPTIVVTILTMLFVLIVFVVPLFPMQVADIKYAQPSCRLAANDGVIIERPREISPTSPSTGGSEAQRSLGDMYDVVMGGREIRAPLALAFLLRVTQGGVNMTIDRFPCSTDMVMTSSKLDTARILDPQLRSETVDFMRWCYNPARMKAGRLREFDPVASGWPGASSWMTDVYYRNSMGDGFYSRRPVAGYSVSDNPIPEAANLDEATQGGFPTCYQWWNGNVYDIGVEYRVEHSLAYRLYQAIPPKLKSIEDYVHEQMRREQMHEHSSQASILRRTFFTPHKMGNFQLDQQSVSLQQSYTGDSGGILRTWQNLTGSVGMMLQTTGQAAGAHTIQIAAPMVKPFILCALIAFSVIAMVLSGYSMKVVGAIYMAILTVMLWPIIWELGRLIEATVLSALGINMLTKNVEDTGQLTIIKQIIRFTSWAFFVFGPLLLSFLLSLLGSSSSGLVGTMNSESSRAGSAGQSGANKVLDLAAGPAKRTAMKGLSPKSK